MIVRSIHPFIYSESKIYLGNITVVTCQYDFFFFQYLDSICNKNNPYCRSMSSNNAKQIHILSTIKFKIWFVIYYFECDLNFVNLNLSCTD